MRRSAAPAFSLVVTLLFAAHPAATATPEPYSCAGLPATLVGTPGDDYLPGTPGRDVIVGRGGNDTIDARGGDDVVCAGRGDDTVQGGSGDDALYGEQGADRLFGNPGADRLYGGRQDDALYGGNGDDVLGGGWGDDALAGGEGADLLAGLEGGDVLHGCEGNDELLGHEGDDALLGGSDDDRIDGGPGVNTVDGGTGIDDCGGPDGVNCELVALAPGDAGPAVAHLQRALTEALFYRGAADGVYGTTTEFAVVAFHKAVEGERTAEWPYDDWAALAAFSPTVPDRPAEPDRIEVDIPRQILTLVEDGEITAIIPVSTASGAAYVTYTGAVVYSRTPRGDFHLYNHAAGWHCSYIGCIYDPWYFSPHYALHGYPKVPPWPASHGCVRVPVWESDWLESRLYEGMPMHVWDRPPQA